MSSLFIFPFTVKFPVIVPPVNGNLLSISVNTFLLETVNGNINSEDLCNRISSIANNKQCNLIFEGSFTVGNNGLVTAVLNSGRILQIPVDRTQSTTGYIEYLATNASWPARINGLGNSPHIDSNGRNITLGAWGTIIGRHSRGLPH